MNREVGNSWKRRAAEESWAACVLTYLPADTRLRLPERRWISRLSASKLLMPTVDSDAVVEATKASRHSDITKEACALAIGMITLASGTSRTRCTGTPRLGACPRCQAGQLIGWQVRQADWRHLTTLTACVEGLVKPFLRGEIVSKDNQRLIRVTDPRRQCWSGKHKGSASINPSTLAWLKFVFRRRTTSDRERTKDATWEDSDQFIVVAIPIFRKGDIARSRPIITRLADSAVARVADAGTWFTGPASTRRGGNPGRATVAGVAYSRSSIIITAIVSLAGAIVAAQATASTTAAASTSGGSDVIFGREVADLISKAIQSTDSDATEQRGNRNAVIKSP